MIQTAFVLHRAREFLGSSCDLQLRVLSRACNESMQEIPLVTAKVEDYLSSVPLFLWARDGMGMPISEGIYKKAASRGHLALLQYFRATAALPWTEGISFAASWGGRLEVLQWLRAQDPPCPWSKRTCVKAANNVRLEVLQWLRAQDPPCPWDARVCKVAADRGHLEALQWLRAQDPPCPWDAQACSHAANRGHLEVLQWLRAQDPPCPKWRSKLCAIFGPKISLNRKIELLVIPAGIEHSLPLESPAQPSIGTRISSAAPALLWLR
jgi:hypothetical protein